MVRRDVGPAPEEADAGALAPGPWYAEQDSILRRLCDAPIERMERNRGGSTISFRVWFQGGMRGLFKPQQTASVANFRAELAAYHLSRVLGANRTPPACGRQVPRAMLQTVADQSGDAAFAERTMRELLGRGDNVPGAMLYWVPGPLENVPDANHWERWLDGTQPVPPEESEVAADMARLILFDYLTDNVDRWSGGNVLRQHLNNQPPGPVLFMDNGASFTIGEGGLGARPRESLERVSRLRRLPRGFVEALRGLTAAALTASVSRDPLGNALGNAQIEAVLSRRARLLQVLDALVADAGAGAWAFP